MKNEINEDDWEEITDDDFEDDEETEPEEEGEIKPWVMLATFGGLVVLAAIICAVLWHFTHSDKENGTPAGSQLSTESVVDTLALESSESMSVASVGDETDNGMEASGELSQGQDDVALSEDSENLVDEPISGNASMEFAEVNDEVTAKDVTNLRSVPSTVDSDNVVAQLKNGDKLSRTGTNSTTGWSRLVYNGEVVYAVTQFLTTDLNYKAPVAASDPNRITTLDGRVIIFADCSDNITPKEYVNLRTEPSTSQGEATVRCQVKSGETVRRTGYSADSGWSRVEYNGEVLYVVSSLMKAAQ